MRPISGGNRRILATWIGLAFAAGVLTAATGSDPAGEAVATGGATDTEASPPPTTARSTTTTAAVETTTTVPQPTTTEAPVVETTLPPTTIPPTTAPPVEEAAPATTVPPPPVIEISFGPETYAENGMPFIHVHGTGCTGPDHTEGGSDFIWDYPIRPGQYGVSYVYTTLDGQWLIRMDPMHAQPGSGDWDLTIPPTGGAGEFLMAATCVNAASVIQPWGSSPSWSPAVLEYPVQRFTVPG